MRKIQGLRKWRLERKLRRLRKRETIIIGRLAAFRDMTDLGLSPGERLQTRFFRLGGRLAAVRFKIDRVQDRMPY